jgi:hypothetical protein
MVPVTVANAALEDALGTLVRTVGLPTARLFQ